MGVNRLPTLKHSLENFRRLQLGADCAFAILHDGCHNACITLKNGDVDARKLFEPIKIGGRDKRGANRDAAHKLAIVHYRKAGPDGERHLRASHYGNGGLAREGNNHGFLIGNAVAVLFGMPTAYDYPLLIGDGHKIRPGLFHQD